MRQLIYRGCMLFCWFLDYTSSLTFLIRFITLLELFIILRLQKFLSYLYISWNCYSLLCQTWTMLVISFCIISLLTALKYSLKSAGTLSVIISNGNRIQWTVNVKKFEDGLTFSFIIWIRDIMLYHFKVSSKQNPKITK